MDNDGVLFSLAKGGGGGPESHMLVGDLWLDLAEAQVDLQVARVESKANVADGPARELLNYLVELGAQFVTPVLPPWVQDLWAGPPKV